LAFTRSLLTLVIAQAPLQVICTRSLLTFTRSLLTLVNAQVPLQVICTRSLLTYTRSLLTYTRSLLTYTRSLLTWVIAQAPLQATQNKGTPGKDQCGVGMVLKQVCVANVFLMCC